MKTITKTVTSTVEVKVLTLKDVENFLYKRGALESYIKNLRRRFPNSLSFNIGEWMKDAGLLRVNSIMSGAFSWDNTSEGFEYWMDLRNEFIKWTEEMGVDEEISLDE